MQTSSVPLFCNKLWFSLWWLRIRSLWKLPDGRDWLRGKQGLVLLGRAMLSKSLIQFPVDGQGCIPSLLFDLRLNYGGGNEDNDNLPQKVLCTLLHSVSPTLQQATTDPCLCSRFLDTHGKVWVSLLWDYCSFLPGPGAHKVLFVPSKSLFHQFFVNSGESMVGLKMTSSKRAYTIPQSAAPRAPSLAAGHSWPHTSAGDTQILKGRSGSVSVRSLGGHKVFLWALWASLVGMGFDSKRDFAPPTILLGFLLCPWMGWVLIIPFAGINVTVR